MLCYNELKLDIRDKSALDDGGIFRKCDCIQGCSETSYGDEVSSAELDNESVRRSLGDVAMSDDYIVGNIAKVNVFFKSPTVTQHERGELFGVVDFVSNVGGLMGLFLGISAISLTEAMYFLGKAVFIWVITGRKEEEKMGRRGRKTWIEPFE